MEATSIDWNHTTNKIVSGSIDRSVFVWSYNESMQKFEPEFVNMDEKLSILTLSWAKNGKKFVAGTSSKLLYVVNEFHDVNVKGVNWNA
jgi:WD40 repeat protein